jgi:hypothetical protein
MISLINYDSRVRETSEVVIKFTQSDYDKINGDMMKVAFLLWRLRPPMSTMIHADSFETQPGTTSSWFTDPNKIG